MDNKLIKSMYKKYKELILYVVFGAGTTIISFASYFLFAKIGIYYITANILSWILAVIFAFCTNKGLVFNDKNHTLKHIAKTLIMFCLSRLASLLVETALMFVGVDIFLIDKYLIKILVSVIVIIMNYVTGKFLVFAKKNK